MPAFWQGLTIRHRLVALAGLSIALALVTAYLGYRTAGALGDALRRATAASAAAYSFMLGDMMHDALHADVLIALRTGPDGTTEAKHAAAADLAAHARILREALADLRRLDLDPELRAAIADVEQPTEAYLASAEEIGALAFSDRSAAEERYAAFFGAFEELGAANAWVGGLIDARGAAIGAEGEATTTRARATLVAFSAGTMLLVAGAAAAVVVSLAQRDASEARMRHMALHDALTGLPNRVLLRERLELALAQARRRGEAVAVLCLDLDRFKEINDGLGHPVGDLLLREVAARLGRSTREGDTVARLGGDEFAVVQVGLDQPRSAHALAQRLLAVLAEPFEFDGHRTVTGASVGVALAPGDGAEADELLKNADIALYRAKAEGRGVARFFEPGMDARLRARRLLEQDLREALAEGRFELHYQPQVEPASGRILGFEALLRWRHPERGEVPPSAFIPLAEETGLILPLGAWVLRRACTDAAAWPGKVKVAVNLSPAQFRQPGLAELVGAALREAGLPPARLELEITEGVLLHETEATLATLRELRRLGVKIAMDDFGTGYSSLSYLRRFPFDKIKIDRSFVAHLGAPDADAIVRAIIGLGRALGMRANAEGVETPEQLARLRAEGCDEVQGYHFSAPQPAAAAAAMLGRALDRDGFAAVAEVPSMSPVPP